jgi:hypothetical protein
VEASLPLGTTRINLWNSSSAMELYESAGAVPRTIDPNPNSRQTGKGWLVAWASVDRAIDSVSEATGKPAVLVLAYRDLLLNSNTIALVSLLRHEPEPVQYQMTPISGHDNVPYFLNEEKLIDPAVDIVLTATKGSDDFFPPLPVHVGIDYVNSLRFEKVASIRLPDGRTISVWMSPTQASDFLRGGQ